MERRRKPLKVSEARSLVMKFGGEARKEWVTLDQSDGRFLAEDLIADHDIPPFDRSPYDGFAVRSKDTSSASTHSPIELRVIGKIGAGSVFSEEVEEGETVRIMTGAKIPSGCDAVIMQEAVKETSKKSIQVRRPVPENKNISFIGEDTKKGTVLAEKGGWINPGITALLATFGYHEVPVSVQPKIGVIVTGSELLNVEDALVPGKIRNSNGPMICSQVKRAGGEPVYFGKLNDDFHDCLREVKASLENTDILITTGGASVGDYDYMPAILEEMGANVLFNKVAMRPGSVTTVAEKEGKLIYALSGNPSACYVGFELFARPVIRKLLQVENPNLQRTTAILGADFPKKNPFDRFVRSKLNFDHGQLIVTPAGLDKSGVVSSLAETNAFILFPGGTSDYRQGMQVEVILLEEQK